MPLSRRPGNSAVLEVDIESRCIRWKVRKGDGGSASEIRGKLLVSVSVSMVRQQRGGCYPPASGSVVISMLPDCPFPKSPVDCVMQSGIHEGSQSILSILSVISKPQVATKPRELVSGTWALEVSRCFRRMGEGGVV